MAGNCTEQYVAQHSKESKDKIDCGDGSQLLVSKERAKYCLASNSRIRIVLDAASGRRYLVLGSSCDGRVAMGELVSHGFVGVVVGVVVGVLVSGVLSLPVESVGAPLLLVSVSPTLSSEFAAVPSVSA